VSAASDKRPASKGGVRGWLDRLSPRSRGIIAGGAAVLLLTAVIVVGSALSSPPEGRPLNTGLTTETSGEDISYQRALLALESGDTTTAVTLLEQVVANDPTNQQAKQALVTARRANSQSRASGSTSSSTGTKSQPATKEDPAFLKPTKNIVALLPRTAEGYGLGVKTAADDDATVSGRPGPDMLGSRALWAVHYRGSEKAAAAFIEQVSKDLYPKDRTTVKIDGASAYFGTDGTRFATVAYVRGRYVFEVTLTTLDGTPSALRVEAEKAAKAFPDKM